MGGVVTMKLMRVSQALFQFCTASSKKWSFAGDSLHRRPSFSHLGIVSDGPYGAKTDMGSVVPIDQIEDGLLT